MKAVAVLLALVASAAAFVPSSPAGHASRTLPTVKASVEDMLGADIETGGLWDPFNFAKDGEAALYRRRCVEIKHGRVAMIATIGYVMGDLITFPGYLSKTQDIKFSDVPAGMGALTAVPIAGWVQIFLFAGLMETKFYKQDPSKAPGDIATPSWWVRYDDPEVKNKKLTSEIKNGRLAMMAIMGMMVQEMVYHQTTISQIQAGNFNPFPVLV
eukprot:CAMPEP_0118973606 /NCGR_PEP_ID=MMETSP1173-20130426/10562_1 /TAXON_ID=1034831 /ORGANISM="Rhizochromulina marina cf, Strain CCMP1243" /LENGTH=212 /DNA_ID=CAMNT_0006923287 /DNA_START=23 /DNA_END=661 /DNA_ORIENTATION=+